MIKEVSKRNLYTTPETKSYSAKPVKCNEAEIENRRVLIGHFLALFTTLSSFLDARAAHHTCIHNILLYRANNVIHTMNVIHTQCKLTDDYSNLVASTYVLVKSMFRAQNLKYTLCRLIQKAGPFIISLHLHCILR